VTSPAGDDDVLLGEVIGVFGFRGELRLMLHHREGDTLRAPRAVDLVAADGTRRRVQLSARPGAGKRILGKVVGVDTEDGARALVGLEIRIPRAELPATQANEWYVRDLFDLPVFDEAGTALGHVADVVAGAVDVWVIERPDGEEAFLVATKEAVKQVDLAAGRVVIDGAALSTGD
jgi:16S rRNA processing protein RimM